MAFMAGLAIAWFAGWDSTDLVWSLWLSSLVVGYSMIVWGLSAPFRELVMGVARDRSRTGLLPAAGVSALIGFWGLFLLAFFTVHFGGFHFVHSVFLGVFFPLDGVRLADEPRLFPPMIGEVFSRYWWFLPAAFVAERAAFKTPLTVEPPDTAVTVAAIEARKRRPKPSQDIMTGPYKNVIRMHLMIFFFAFAHFVKFENFAVYTVVYAVYFFPWRLLRKNAAPLPAAAG